MTTNFYSVLLILVDCTSLYQNTMGTAEWPFRGCHEIEETSFVVMLSKSPCEMERTCFDQDAS